MTESDALNEINGILEKQKKQQINPELTSKLYKNSTISSEKMLLNYSSDVPRIFHTTLTDIFNAHKAVETKLTEGLAKKAIPIILIFAVLMGVVILISNIPQILNSVADNFGVEKQIQIETKIVYLTEDEAKAKGITIPTKSEPTKSEPVPPVPVVIPPVTVITPTETEGFDIIGNLVPKPIPLAPSLTKVYKPLCPQDSKRQWNTAESRWYCVDPQGIATPQTVGYKSGK